MSSQDQAQTPHIPPPFDPREYVTKDELRTYYPTKEDLAKLETTIEKRIGVSQKWIISVIGSLIVIATSAIGWLVSLD